MKPKQANRERKVIQAREPDEPVVRYAKSRLPAIKSKTDLLRARTGKK